LLDFDLLGRTRQFVKIPYSWRNPLDDTPDIGFMHAPIGLIMTRHRVIQRCNVQFCETFGLRRDQLQGHSLSKLYPSTEEFLRIGTAGAKLMKATGRYVNERIMRRSDGELFWCRVRGNSLTVNDPFAQAIWSFADISDNRPVLELSKRERQVAILVAEGRTSKEIAWNLSLSPRTVEAHRARLIEKFDARNSAELIARLTGMPL
jgi:PAS domain S-box-containing protein